MKRLNWPVKAIIFMGLLQAVSCTKTSNNGPSDALSLESSSNATATNQFINCKLRYIIQPTYGTALFTYNRVGNPYSVLYETGGTGTSDHYFKYDAQNRLTEYIQMWGSQEFEHHYYRYNAINQIRIDSAVSMDAVGQPHRVNVSTIEYDAQGKVVKETIINIRNDDGPLAPTRRPTYTYDSRGNIGVLGWRSSSYDYKINPLRQSPVFQFIHLNYSMNNAAPQAKYNSRGLPLSMNPSNDVFFNEETTSKVLYDCN